MYRIGFARNALDGVAVATDSTIPPPQKKTAIFLNERFMDARHKKGCS